MSPRISVVVATYNRAALLKDLLEDLAGQTVPPSEFEVILVDDGSKDPVQPHVAHLALPYRLHVERQDNAGQARARQKGIELAAGEIVVIIDDDMAIPPDFLESHLRAHDAGLDVVMGFIQPPTDARLPLFEKFHADQLVKFASAVEAGAPVKGVHLATGNVSFKRADFLEVGGFDPSLKRSEDRELGIRFEKARKRLGFSRKAYVVHNSDHASLEGWMNRSFQYGVYDTRISEKHEDVESADPWSFLSLVNPVSRPALLFSALLPGPASLLAKAAMKASLALDRAGLERVALKGCTFAYGVQYFRGVREQNGRLAALVDDMARFLVKREREASKKGERRSPLSRFAARVLADYALLGEARAKYHGDAPSLAKLPADAVTKIGFQMMVAVRVMGLLKDARVPLGPQVMSRLIRHVYGAEIHWDADLAPGVAVVHGNGLVVSHAAKVGEGAILFQNATLGESLDPETGVVGGPALGRNVHVGPGAVLLGPIQVGDGSKVMAGAVLNKSVPPSSLVAPAEARVQSRSARDPAKAPAVPR